MGLLQVGKGALESVLADSWREYFYCKSLDEDTLVTKGTVRKAKKAFNTKGSDNLISNGSIIAVNEGQCMMIVQNGAIVEVSAEAGEFVWDSSTEPSIFYGGLRKGIVESFNQWKKRFTLGGDTGTDQRVYFFNTKKIIGNKYGTVNPIPYRVVDSNIGLDMDMAIRCHGEYSYVLEDPVLFYKNVCGNTEEDYKRSRIDSQLKAEVLTALQPAFASISAQGIRYSMLPAYTKNITEAMNEELSKTWGKTYGIELETMTVSSATLSDEDAQRIKKLQEAHVLSNPSMSGAILAQAQAEAMVEAAKNKEAGPMMAFAGMNMAQNAGGMNAQVLFETGRNQGIMNQNQLNQNPSNQSHENQGSEAMVLGKNNESENQAMKTWTCKCGKVNTGKFCSECGERRPSEWTCKCGKVNTGKFCSECGKERPSEWICKCGKINTGKFCSECGKERP